MNKEKIILSLSIILLITIVSGFILYDQISQNALHGEITSPYVGEHVRYVKSLSTSDIDGLKSGTGTPFGGMAKLAELNGYPGPRHVLDLAQQMELTDSQTKQIEYIYQEMNSEAKILGNKILSIEMELDEKFSEGLIDKNHLKEKISESAEFYAKLRNVHLQSHIVMMDVLTLEQIQKYNELRGYTLDNPCKNIPEGHDLEMWRLHNNCQ
jgi:Spy/CpxP family protein refolding chaperone